MPNLEMQDLKNAQELWGIVNEHFNYVQNKRELVSDIIAFAEKHKLRLEEFTEQWREMIVKYIKLTIKNNQYDPKAMPAFAQILSEIKKLNEKQLFAHANQPRESSMIEDLKNKKYVKTRRLTDVEIKQMFDFYLKDQQEVIWADPLSLTLNNGESVSEFLNTNKDTKKKLLIPVNIDNYHYVLFIKNPGQDRLVCWEPLSEKESPVKSKKTLLLLNQMSEKLGLEIEYKFASEQHDPISCGYRITQKAFKEAGLNNEFVRVPVDNTTSLCTTFIKQLINTDETLRSEKLEIAEGTTPLVYLSSAAADISAVIKDEKTTQIVKDEKLAIVLQDIYNTDPQISSEAVAIQSAKQRLMELSSEEFAELHQSVFNWATNWAKQLHDSKNTSKRKEEIDTVRQSSDSAVNQKR